MRLILLFVLALPLSLSAQTTRWFGQKGSGFAVDTTTIETVDSTTVRAWIKITATPTSHLIAGKKFASAMIQLLTKCDARQIATISSTYYNVAGTVINSSSSQYPELQSVQPESNGEAWYEMICFVAESGDKISTSRVRL